MVDDHVMISRVKIFYALQELLESALCKEASPSLSKIENINLDTRLSQVAGQVGLGSSGVYTVKSKEIVLNVEFNVTIDAGDVERAIITRSKSIIRDRINLMMENSKNLPHRDDAAIKKTGTQHGLLAVNQP